MSKHQESSMINIREVKKEDLPEVEELLSYTWADTYASLLSDKIIKKVTSVWHNPKLLDKQIENPNVHFLIAADESEKIIGLSTIIKNEENNVVMGRLYIHPEQQRKGTGTLLLKKSIDSFPLAGRIHLEIEENDIKGVNFYKKHNFKVMGKREENIEGTKLNVLIMEKELKK